MSNIVHAPSNGPHQTEVTFDRSKWSVEYNPKPIPASCGVDWDFCHKDYDGEGDNRCGNCASEAECWEEIEWIESEMAEVLS